MSFCLSCGKIRLSNFELGPWLEQRLYFSAFFAAGCDHVTPFLPVGCEGKCHVWLPGRGHALSFPLLLLYWVQCEPDSQSSYILWTMAALKGCWCNKIASVSGPPHRTERLWQRSTCLCPVSRGRKKLILFDSLQFGVSASCRWTCVLITTLLSAFPKSSRAPWRWAPCLQSPVVLV